MPQHDQRHGHAGSASDAWGGHAGGAPGKRTLTSRLPAVQRRAGTDPIVIGGVALTAASGDDDFRALDNSLDVLHRAGFHRAAALGPDALLDLFRLHGVVIAVDQVALARTIAARYAEWVARDAAVDEVSAPLTDRHASLGKGNGDGAGGGPFGGLLDKLGRLTAEVEVGQYVKASLAESIPVPEVPGLTLDTGGELTFTWFAGGKLSLEASITQGATWELFELIDVSVSRTLTVELHGDDLGAALVDALLQSVRVMVQLLGVEQQLVQLRRLAEHGPNVGDLVDAFIGSACPWSGKPNLATLAIAKLGGRRVIELVDAYFAFFHDRPDVGFSVSFQQQTSAGAGGTEVALDATLGIEDVGDEEAMPFAALGGHVKAGPVEIDGEVRIRGDGAHWKLGIEVEVPWAGGSAADAVASFATNARFGQSLARAVHDGRSSDRAVQRQVLAALADGLATSALQVFGTVAGVHVESSLALGLHLEFSSEGVHVHADARTRTGFEVDADLVKGGFERGSVLDVTPYFREPAEQAMAL